MKHRLFPGDYAGEPADLPGLKLVQVPASGLFGPEYAIVRFYRSESGATTMRSILRAYDCVYAKRQFRLLCRALRAGCAVLERQQPPHPMSFAAI
jgi:hypothetical protein